MPTGIPAGALTGLLTGLLTGVLAVAALAPVTLRAQESTAASRADSSSAGVAPAAPAERPPLLRIFTLPVIGYAPETKAMGGLAVIGLMRREDGDSADRPSTASASATYTQRDQVMVGAGGEYWSRGNRWRLEGGTYFTRYPYRLYGIGNDTPDEPELYTPVMYGGGLDARRLVRPHLYVGGDYELQRTEIRRKESGGLLDTGAVTGSDGGRLSSLGVLTSWDTRDNIFWPSRGGYTELNASRADGAIGSDFDFTRVTFDTRRYLRVGARRVLALQGVLMATSGDVPFHRLPQLGGGSVMRGYLQGRYRDKALAAVQAEFRTPVWRRLGLALFAGVGEVAPSVSDFRLADIRPGSGFGLRYMLSKEEKLNLRFDLGVGQNSSGTYVTLGEAF